MRTAKNALAFLLLLVCLPLPAQDPTAEPSETEARDLAAIQQLMKKTRQGGDSPNEKDLLERRQAGIEMAKRGQQFLKDHPSSGKEEDARALTGLGLYEATLAGDSSSAKELEEFATRSVEDPKLPQMSKLHAFILNYIAGWATKNQKHNLNQGSAEFQSTYLEALFAAAGVLPDKESIFKMLLLQSKSGRELTAAQKKSIAERVVKHPAASALIKAEAEKILSNEPTHAIGKPLEIRFTAVDGRQVDLQQMKGKVVLVDFWATWCGPCIAEVPNLKKAYDTHHAKGFEIIGISLDDKKKDLLEFIRKHELPWPQHFDGQHWNNEISFRFGINSVPTQWLVDKKGILRNLNARHDLERAVERLLKEE